jgi:hypothetical protein
MIKEWYFAPYTALREIKATVSRKEAKKAKNAETTLARLIF